MKALLIKPQNLVFLLLAVIGVLYFQTINSLYFLWMESGSPAYSHGSLAFLIALYIFAKFWFDRNATLGSNIPFKLDVVGLLMLLGATALWMLATLGNIQVIQQLAFLGLVGFTFWAAFGFAVFQKLVIPLAIMLTTIPIWDFLDIYLQYLTALGVGFLLNFTTIPFVREGVHILLQSGTFEIADRCSGLRMLTAIVPVALLYCYQWKFRGWVTFCYVLLSMLVAVFVNVIRILIVVIAGHLTEMKHYFVTTDHVTLGWVVFGVLVLVFIFLSNKLLLTEKLYSRLISNTVPEKKIVPETENLQSTSAGAEILAAVGRKETAVLLVVGLVIATGPALAKKFSYSGTAAAAVSVEFNTVYGKWQVAENVRGTWVPIYHGQDFEKQLLFQNASGDSVQFYLAYYKTQQQGKEAIHYENRAFDPLIWKKISDRLTRRDFPGIGEVLLREIKIHSLAGQKKLIWQWYYVGGNRTSSRIKTKLYEILGKLTSNPAISVIMVAADMNSSESAAEMQLIDFTQAFVTGLEEKLDSVHP